MRFPWKPKRCVHSYSPVVFIDGSVALYCAHCGDRRDELVTVYPRTQEEHGG